MCVDGGVRERERKEKIEKVHHCSVDSGACKLLAWTRQPTRKSLTEIRKILIWNKCDFYSFFFSIATQNKGEQHQLSIA